MWIGFLLTLVVGVLWGGVGVLNSKVSRRGLDFAAYAATGVLLGAAVMWTAWVRYPVLAAGPPFVWRIALICGSAGIVAGLGYVALQRAMQSGHHGAVWTVSQSAMVLPLLTALIGWGEVISPAGIIGMALLMAALVTFGFGNYKAGDDAEAMSTSWFWFALLAFLMFGLSQSLNSIPSLQHWPDEARIRTPCYMAGQCCFYLTWMWHKRSGFRRPETLLAVRYALYGATSMVLMYHAMDLLAVHRLAGMTFPVSVGTCIVVFALYSVAWLKERSGIHVTAGMLLAVAGVASLILRGLGW